MAQTRTQTSYAVLNRIKGSQSETIQPTQNETAATAKRVNINVNVKGDGSVIGDGTYTTGSTVLLRAVPDKDGFIGWYDDQGKLLSKKDLYDFSAETNQTLTAVFGTEVEDVKLDATTKELTEDETTQLTATVSPENATDKTITWTSDKPNVATVDSNGKVTAVGAGTATITAKCGDKTAICEITVKTKAPEAVKVTGISFDKNNLELTVDNTEKLTATVKPDNATDKTVNWSSEDANVATVDGDGNVKALKAGQTTITSTAADGSGVKAKCTVTVKAKADSGSKDDHKGDDSGKTNPRTDEKPDQPVAPAQPAKPNQPSQTQDIKQATNGNAQQQISRLTENKTKVNHNKTMSAKTSQNVSSAKTGDTSQVALWFALMFMACSGLSVVIVYGRKHRE